jgi:hypothetical protein
MSSSSLETQKSLDATIGYLTDIVLAGLNRGDTITPASSLKLSAIADTIGCHPSARSGSSGDDPVQELDRWLDSCMLQHVKESILPRLITHDIVIKIPDTVVGKLNRLVGALTFLSVCQQEPPPQHKE